MTERFIYKLIVTEGHVKRVTLNVGNMLKG